jgi:hypothetical protein
MTAAITPYDRASELHCASCGAKGGEGWSLISQQSHCNRILKKNEFVLRQGGWSYVYEHNCGSKGGAA